MPTYSVAALKPGNIIVQADSEKEAVILARDGHGEWQADDGGSIEIQHPISVAELGQGGS